MRCDFGTGVAGKPEGFIHGLIREPLRLHQKATERTRAIKLPETGPHMKPVGRWRTWGMGKRKQIAKFGYLNPKQLHVRASYRFYHAAGLHGDYEAPRGSNQHTSIGGPSVSAAGVGGGEAGKFEQRGACFANLRSFNNPRPSGFHVECFATFYR